MNAMTRKIPGLDWPWKLLSEAKNQFYDRNMAPTVRVSVPILSLGNLTMGGTGKTPMIIDFVRHFESEWRIAVINRSYGGSLRKPQCLDPRKNAFDASKSQRSSVVGDEALLLQQKFQKASVFTGPNKSETARFAVQKDAFDFIVVDDGFQHRRLYRDADVVILDATELMENYRCFPKGRAREDWSSLARAQFVFITKVNLVSPAQVQRLLNQIDQVKREYRVDLPVFQFAFLNDRVERAFLGSSPELVNQEVLLQELEKKPVVALSGIGHPLAFEKSLQILGLKIEDHFRFPDHHRYTLQDFRSVQKKAAGRVLITTEKDLVKLRELKLEQPFEICVLTQQVACLTDKQQCYQQVWQKLVRCR